ncbi:MAG: hypothetical protein ACTHKL_25435, partial [Streptosporangiaceae bacterium]
DGSFAGFDLGSTLDAILAIDSASGDAQSIAKALEYVRPRAAAYAAKSAAATGKLTAAIVAAGGPSYDSREIDPVNDQDGGQPGGNIRVVFLFNPNMVSFVDAGASTVNRSTTGTQVVKKPASLR